MKSNQDVTAGKENLSIFLSPKHIEALGGLEEVKKRWPGVMIYQTQYDPNKLMPAKLLFDPFNEAIR